MSHPPGRPQGSQRPHSSERPHGSQRPRGSQQKLAEIRRQQRARQTRMRMLAGAAALAAIALVVVAVIAFTGGRTTAQKSPRAATGAMVDGIRCQASAKVAYHIHAHLAIYVSGSRQVVPAGIGIPGPQQVVNGFVEGGKCLYWLHTHDTTGIIHVESPAERVYTLGQFFDIWGRPLSGTQVGGATGHVTVFVNGKRFAGDPRAIKFTPHAVIQLDVGKVVLPQPFTFAAGL